MEDLTPKEQKKLERLADFVEDEALATVAQLIEIESKLDEVKETLEEKLESVETSLESLSEELKKKPPFELDFDKEELKGEPGKDGLNGENYVLTESDKEEIASKVPVPIVEKVIERTEVIKEQPIVTNEIKEVASPILGEEIVEKINELPTKTNEFKIDASHIKNLPIFKGGATQLAIRDYLAVKDEGTLLTDRATSFNFVGAGVTATASGDQVTVTIDGGAGGTPGGSDTQVQFNDGGSFGGDSAFTWDKTSNLLNINSGGKINVGTPDTMVLHGTNIISQFQANADSYVSYEAHGYSDDASQGGFFYGAKSRGSTASPTIVGSGDIVQATIGLGYDGTDMEYVGYTAFEVDGTPGNNDMPGRYVIYTTADGAFTPTERLRIANTGAWGIAGANFGTSGSLLVSGGSGSPPSWTALSSIDHNSLANLTVGDVHTQYAFLAGRSGGQSLTGGTASGNDLTLISTSHATKGSILVPENSFEMTSNRSRHDAEDSGFIVDAGGNARVGLMKFTGYFPAFTRGLGAGLSMGEYSNASLAVNGGTYTEEVNLSDSGFRFDVDAWGNGEDKGLFWDSGGNTRLGFVKKSAALPCLAFGNTTDFEIKEWSTTSMLTNIASGSGTSRFKIASGGLTSIYNSLTIGSGATATDYSVTFDGETNDGIFTWMEDEDYFAFSDDVFLNSAEQLYFRATSQSIYSSAVSTLDIQGATINFRRGNGTIESTFTERTDIAAAVVQDLKVTGNVYANFEYTGSADIMLGGLVNSPGSYAGMWLAQASPDASNYLLLGSASASFINAPSGGYLDFRVGNSTVMSYDSSGVAILKDNNVGADKPFAVFGSFAGTEIFSVTSTNVGIQTTSPTARLHLPAGTTSASTAPLKLTTGTSMTSAEAGAVEYTTDDLFFTISTGTARKRILFADPSGGLTSGRVPFATTNGRLTDDADLTFATDTLTATHYRANATITFDEEVDNGNSSTADTIDWTAGNVQKSTLTGNVTYTFTAPAAPGLFSLKMTQDGTGGRTATWPATVKWQRGINPFNGTQAASEIDIAYFRFDGTNYQAWATYDHK